MTALAYVIPLAVAGGLLATRSSATRQAWLDWASTDLANLGSHPVGALLTSAFLPDGDLLAWIALSLIGLVSAGHALGNLRCALLVVVAHVVATLVSEGVLARQIATGAAAVTDRTLLDVGCSYVVVPALVVGIAYGAWPARIVSAIGFVALAPDLFGGLSRLEVAPVGHCCTILLALGLGYLLRRSWSRSPGYRRHRSGGADTPLM